jgi:hypothetical protein
MTLAVPTMTAAIMGMAAMSVATAVEPYTCTAQRLDGTFLWRGKNHAPKEKKDDTGEHQQHDSDVHPSGWGHLNLARFQRPRSQFNSTMQM